MSAAEADGFRMFLPGVKQPPYDFTNWRWAIEAMLRFDPAKPTSLLYRQERDGRFELAGAGARRPVQVRPPYRGKRPRLWRSGSGTTR